MHLTIPGTVPAARIWSQVGDLGGSQGARSAGRGEANAEKRRKGVWMGEGA